MKTGQVCPSTYTKTSQNCQNPLLNHFGRNVPLNTKISREAASKSRYFFDKTDPPDLGHLRIRLSPPFLQVVDLAIEFDIDSTLTRLSNFPELTLSAPGLSQEQTRVWSRTNLGLCLTVLNKEKTWVCPRFSPSCVPGTNLLKYPGQTRGRPKTNRTKKFMFMCLFAYND